MHMETFDLEVTGKNNDGIRTIVIETRVDHESRNVIVIIPIYYKESLEADIIRKASGIYKNYTVIARVE